MCCAFSMSIANKDLPVSSLFLQLIPAFLRAPVVSEIAAATIKLPSAILGRKSSFCFSLPARINAFVARIAVERNGPGVVRLPRHSATIAASNEPRPTPPYSSGIKRAGIPSSVRPDQMSNPLSSAFSAYFRTLSRGIFSSRKRLTLSCSAICS